LLNPKNFAVKRRSKAYAHSSLEEKARAVKKLEGMMEDNGHANEQEPDNDERIGIV
jgi:hypothetical protein